jgi:thymidine kinase
VFVLNQTSLVSTVLQTQKMAARVSGNTATQQKAGSVVVVKGCMFSGKSSEFQRRIKRARVGRQNVQVFKPLADARSPSGKVESRDFGTMDATDIESLDEVETLLRPGVTMIAIDECQFLPGIATFCADMSRKGFDILVCGLDFTFEGKPFEPPTFGNILNIVADEQVHLTAVCVVCSDTAIFSQHIGAAPKEGVKDVGGADKYRAVCRSCFNASN